MGQRNFQKAEASPRSTASALFPSLLILVATLASAWALEPQNELGMYLEPSHMAPGISHPVKGANSTVLVPARFTKYGVDTFTKTEWETAGLDEPQVQLEALALASQLNQSAEVEYVKDAKDVIEYAIIESEHPFISSIIFPKKSGKNEFIGRFEKIFGKEVLVVIPERHTIYIFPRYAPTLQKYGPSLAQKYRDEPLKGSLEVFLVDENDCQVIGKIGS